LINKLNVNIKDCFFYSTCPVTNINRVSKLGVVWSLIIIAIWFRFRSHMYVILVVVGLLLH